MLNLNDKMNRFDDVTNTQQIYWAVVKEIENKLKTALMWKYREIDLVIPILYVVYNNLGLKKGETNWGHRNLAAFVRPEEKYFFFAWLLMTASIKIQGAP